ncbi:MAG: family 10 glycosylhydrolase [Candidatus Cloacimonetes bacterium]|nr:family 10 glycosylhydrolase [Candidatus Cloacimonadota bacterium]MDD3144383.1 family 10 glycosylhydrolase [Candidatus Cloacimonadota bacterium]MDY0366222.1 family 10 glycosylhydrolase [Candidatus Syntrophosphaera sp.]
MRKVMLILVLAGLALCLGAQVPEVRAIWVLPWSMNTPERVDAFIASAAASQQTDIYVEVRYRADALYQTNRRRDAYPNPEYRSHVLDEASFDPLELILREAHKRNLRVHAWIVVLNATPADPELMQRNYVYRNHRDWITFDRNLMRPSAAENSGHFIDPGIPAVQEHILNVAGDLLSGYPELDGLHLDYIRYPNSSLGYHPISMSRYNDVKVPQNLDWNEWRVLQVTSLVEKLRQLVDEVSPSLIFSAAVMPDPASAARYYAQDWKDWLERGLVDYVCPMNYAADIAKFRDNLDAAAETDLSERIVMGVRAWNDNGASLAPSTLAWNYNILDVAERIGEIRRRGFAGIALFSYDGLLKDSALQHLSRVAYSDELVAELAALDPLGESTARTRFAADVKVHGEGRLYSLELLVPLEGRWTLELRDPFDRVHYRRERFYLKGLNQDHWNGVLANGAQIVPGTYLISLYRDLDRFEYVIPVSLPELVP